MPLSWSAIGTEGGSLGSEKLAKHRSCPVCGHDKYKSVFSVLDFQFYCDSSTLPKRMDISQVQCLRCFAVYLNPCFSDFGFRALLTEAGQSYGASVNRPRQHVQWLSNRGLLTPDASLLDVGCYDGRFLALLPENVRKIGVDIDQVAIERGREVYAKHQIEFILGDFETFHCSSSPDVVTMYHVLEHLPSPVAVLKKLRSIAHGSTRLVVEVPILENGLTNDVNGFFGAIHTSHFSRQSFRNCLRRGGWRIMDWQEQPDYNGCRVLAEPAELDVEVMTDAEDIARVIEYLSGWYGELSALNRKLNQISNNVRRCIIWGAGLHTEFLYQLTSFFHANPGREYAIVDSDTMKHGKRWRGIEIYPPSVLIRDVDWKDTGLLLSSYGKQDAIAQEAQKLGVPSEKLFRLYEVLRIH